MVVVTPAACKGALILQEVTPSTMENGIKHPPTASAAESAMPVRVSLLISAIPLHENTYSQLHSILQSPFFMIFSFFVCLFELQQCMASYEGISRNVFNLNYSLNAPNLAQAA